MIPASLLLLLAACGGNGEERASAPAPAEVAAAPAELVDASWPVRMADAAARAPYERNPGWARLFTRAYDEALSAFGDDGAGLGRVHLELAGLYRQAALLAARATLEVYGSDRTDFDPAEVDYLLLASGMLAGDCERARAASDALSAEAARELAPQVGFWRSALRRCPALPEPPDDAVFPGQPPAEVRPGSDPGAGALPHYRFRERTEEAREVEAADPTTLWLLARWHERAAVAASGASEELVAALLAPWRLPGEAPPEADLSQVGDTWLFGGFALSGADAAFLAAGPAPSGVAAWADRSVLAAALLPAVEGERIEPDRVLDQAAALRAQVQAAMARVAGREEDFHRRFADIAMLGVLRAGARVAAAGGQERDSGILMINALERSTGPGADPVFMLGVAAWDTGHRNPLRPQEILHDLARRYPALEAARYPMDALHVRLSRNAAPITPAH